MVTESEMVTEGDLGLTGTAARRTCTAPGADGRTPPRHVPARWHAGRWYAWPGGE